MLPHLVNKPWHPLPPKLHISEVQASKATVIVAGLHMLNVRLGQLHDRLQVTCMSTGKQKFSMVLQSECFSFFCKEYIITLVAFVS